MIPKLHPIAATVRPLNTELWDLIEQEASGTISPRNRRKLQLMFKVMGTEQDSTRDAGTAQEAPATDNE